MRQVIRAGIGARTAPPNFDAADIGVPMPAPSEHRAHPLKLLRRARASRIVRIGCIYGLRQRCAGSGPPPASGVLKGSISLIFFGTFRKGRTLQAHAANRQVRAANRSTLSDVFPPIPASVHRVLHQCHAFDRPGHPGSRSFRHQHRSHQGTVEPFIVARVDVHQLEPGRPSPRTFMVAAAGMSTMGMRRRSSAPSHAGTWTVAVARAGSLRGARSPVRHRGPVLTPTVPYRA